MSNVIPLFGSSTQQIRLVKPKVFEEVQQVIEQLKHGQLILINVSEVSPCLAQRIIDVLSGSVDILSGQVVNVGNGVFLYSLSDIEVSAFRKHLAA
ncbi:cell division protein SepF [Acaryochloris marina]|uniref:cell division protein SepF n=1 Tax=Acaryochloris marina TaxID=155978 RepID=UPI001BB02451|nr:cell division protein SepF [Acaryochloris marina]QUY44260.1 cell division protein SepF [Acaryochloris marina S15]